MNLKRHDTHLSDNSRGGVVDVLLLLTGAAVIALSLLRHALEDVPTIMTHSPAQRAGHCEVALVDQMVAVREGKIANKTFVTGAPGDFWSAAIIGAVPSEART